MLGAASRPMRVRIRVESLKIVGRSLAWVNGTYDRGDGRMMAFLFKGAEHLAALRDDALASTQAELTIEATVTPGADANTLVAIEYHGRISDATHDLEQDMHAVVVKSGKRSCEMHWSVRGEQWCEDQPKSERHNVFATWLVHTFGAEWLRKGAGVVDVAGGSGHLAAALRGRTDALVTVIDPLEDFENADGTRWHDGPTLPAPTILLRERFDADFVERDAAAPAPLLSRCSLLCGMHPDQATEACIDAALALGKPFAVVPCCTFNMLFPNRRRRNGDGVRVYKSFVDYLQEKDDRIERATLPFQGRNTVLFWHGDTPDGRQDANGSIPCSPCTSAA